MESVDYIVSADYIVPMDESLHVIKDGAVATKGSGILGVGSREEISRKYTARNIISGDGKVVFPGLINTHTHAAMVYFRGLADDLPLREWLENHILPAESRWLSPEVVSNSVFVSFLQI